MSNLTIKTLKRFCQSFASWLSSVVILLGCLWLGQLISVRVHQVLPGSMIGMILLACLLGIGWVRLSWVETGAGFLLRWMSLLFVPVGVGVIDQVVMLRAGLPVFVLTCIGGTVLIMAVTGWLFQLLEPTS